MQGSKTEKKPREQTRAETAMESATADRFEDQLNRGKGCAAAMSLPALWRRSAEAEAAYLRAAELYDALLKAPPGVKRDNAVKNARRETAALRQVMAGVQADLRAKVDRNRFVDDDIDRRTCAPRAQPCAGVAVCGHAALPARVVWFAISHFRQLRQRRFAIGPFFAIAQVQLIGLCKAARSALMQH
eukprot:gene542-1291_t